MQRAALAVDESPTSSMVASRLEESTDMRRILLIALHPAVDCTVSVASTFCLIVVMRDPHRSDRTAITPGDMARKHGLATECYIT